MTNYLWIVVILIIFSYIAILLLYPVNPLEMALQLMFPCGGCQAVSESEKAK